MVDISVSFRICDGAMGEGWKDVTDAAFAFAAFVESRWEDDLEPLREAGHSVSVNVEVIQFTNGPMIGPDVYASDNENGENDRLAIDAGSMLTLLVDLGIEWDQTPEALALLSDDDS